MIETIKSVPKNIKKKKKIQLSKEPSHQMPWSVECLTPQLLKGNSYRIMGFTLRSGRQQTPLLFSHWQCSWLMPLCS